jgi:thioredoxin-dependent peroxiredoxin
MKPMKRSIVSLFILIAGSILLASAQDAPPKTLKVGDPAPVVSGINQDGKPWNLADQLGKKVVLVYFYPKDGTPGCTAEACGLRDRMGDLRKDNVSVFGVSFDSAASHLAFREKNQLNFDLIADTDGKIADAFGARRAGGANITRRLSFLVGRDGKIAHIVDNPSAAVHLEEMKTAIGKLAAEK